MAALPSRKDILVLSLKLKVFNAAKHNNPQAIRDCLASLQPDAVKDVLHHCSEFEGLQSTPLIIATWKGHLEVVELLVNEFDVDVNQTVVNCFHKHHALISAVYRGHLDIVKFLVTHNCDVSVQSRYRKTVVSVACEENRLDILKYLVENCAQINEFILEDGQKYLEDACWKGYGETVDYLLSKGVDPNKQDDDGRTILHEAAHRGASDIVTMFLHYKSVFTKDRYGRTPLIEAAMNAFSDCVKIFMASVDLSELERIEGLELLGARLAQRNVDEAFMYMKQAMAERCKNPNHGLVKPHSPLPTLDNVQESQTLEELQARQSEPHLFRLECLAILNRILGPADFVTVTEFIDYCLDLESAGRHFDSMAVLLYGMKAAVKGSTSPIMNRSILHFLSLKFVNILQHGIPNFFSYLAEIMEHIFEMMEKKDSICFANFAANELLLRYILVALKVAQGQEEGRRLQRLTEHCIRLSPGSTVLHTAVGLKWSRPNFLCGLEDLPFDMLISFLLQCGADVHVKDVKKNTALHTIACLSQKEEEDALFSRMARTLLDAGAIVSVQNNDGKTPLDLAGPELAAELRELYPASLKSLAATTVVNYKISYIGEIPNDLAEFTEKH